MLGENELVQDHELYPWQVTASDNELVQGDNELVQGDSQLVQAHRTYSCRVRAPERTSSCKETMTSWPAAQLEAMHQLPEP